MKSKNLINIELIRKEALLLFSAISKLERDGSLDTVLTEPEKYCVSRVQSSIEGNITSSHDDLTLQIDSLARNGLRLTDFYMGSPVCSASRAAMLTGCYPPRIGFGPSPVLFPGQDIGLSTRETTIAKVLQAAGYKTQIVGKWHCGDQPEFLPTRHGFDHYFGIPYSNDMGRQSNHPDRPPLPLLRDETVIQEQPDQRGVTERVIGNSIANGWVNTGDWLGYVNVDNAPWIYSDDLDNWMYIEEANVSSSGGWVFVVN